MKSYEEENWARLSPAFRAAHNRLRMARGEPPIPEPRIDHYVPPRATSTPLPFNPADPEAIAVEAEFRGLGDQAPVWEGIAKRLVLELARNQLRDRRLHTEVLHRAIAQFVALAVKEVAALEIKGWNRKKIIGEAMKIFGVSTRTVETALKEFLVTETAILLTKSDFTPTTAVTAGLSIELRLLALGLPLPR
jgi:hypothetical protein